MQLCQEPPGEVYPESAGEVYGISGEIYGISGEVVMPREAGYHAPVI